jgi:hypothetical protein
VAANGSVSERVRREFLERGAASEGVVGPIEDSRSSMVEEMDLAGGLFEKYGPVVERVGVGCVYTGCGSPMAREGRLGDFLERRPIAEAKELRADLFSRRFAAECLEESLPFHQLLLLGWARDMEGERARITELQRTAHQGRVESSKILKRGVTGIKATKDTITSIRPTIFRCNPGPSFFLLFHIQFLQNLLNISINL